ncbi:MAG: hypothetical protein Q4B50_03435 [Bacillota bacterium]|nr:hypothetical protein [Bacillota bacterium]
MREYNSARISAIVLAALDGKMPEIDPPMSDEEKELYYDGSKRTAAAGYIVEIPFDLDTENEVHDKIYSSSPAELAEELGLDQLK